MNTKLPPETNGGHIQRIGVSTVKAQAVGSSPRYTCSMHPEVVIATPGNCPKCGMPLVPLGE